MFAEKGVALQHASTCTHKEPEGDTDTPRGEAAQVARNGGGALEGFLREVAAVTKQLSQIIPSEESQIIAEREEAEKRIHLPTIPESPDFQVSNYHKPTFNSPPNHNQHHNLPSSSTP